MRKFHFTKWLIIPLAVAVALGSMGVTYACHYQTWWTYGWWNNNNCVTTDPCNTRFMWAVSNDNGVIESRGGYNPIDPGDNGIDPAAPQEPGTPLNPNDRWGKNVASTAACLIDYKNIEVVISNAYPSYYPTVFYGLKNKGTRLSIIKDIEVDEDATTPDVMDDIDELTVTVSGIEEGQEIAPGCQVTGNLEIHVEQPAEQNHTYTIRVKINYVCAIRTCGTGYAYGGNYATCFEEINSKYPWGWTNGTLLSPGNYTFDMYVGAAHNDITKGALAGTVTVNYNGSSVTVTYNLDDGYTMDETHLYVGTKPLPTYRGSYTVSPGQYPYAHDLHDATKDSYRIGGFSGRPIYVIAHANVYWYE